MMKKLLIVSCFLASSAFAHDTYIIPDHFDGCGAVTLHMTSGMDFPKLDFAIQPDRVTKSYIYVSKKRTPLEPLRGSKSLDFEIDVPERQTAIVAVDLAPKTLELTPAQVDEYLDEIGASNAIRDEWKAHPGRWRETYTKHAKTFIRCGDDPERMWIRGGLMDYEIVPQSVDPATLHAGDTIRLFLAGGKNISPEVPIIMVNERGERTIGKKDKTLITEFTIPAPGRYMFTATKLRHSDSKDVDWISDFATLTLEIK